MRKYVQRYSGGRGGAIDYIIDDREGSAELFCMNRFIFVTEDSSSLDAELIIHARTFARKLSQFLNVYIPNKL
jgi:hypothetical protein